MSEENKGKDDQEVEEFLMVGDGADEGSQQAAAEDDDKKKEGKEEGEELEASDDERAGHGDDDDDKTEARKKERKSRRARQKAARERDQTELKFLRKRNEQVETQIMDLARRQNATEMSAVDRRLSEIDNAIRSADDVLAKAIDANEGKDAAEATNIRDKLRDQHRDLTAFKNNAGAEAEAQPTADPGLVANVKTWHERNAWFNFERADQDSAIAGAIDDQMAREGLDPRSPEYYDEFDKRIAKVMPHRAIKSSPDDDGDGGDDDEKDLKNNREPRGPKFRAGGRERPLKSNEVYIDRDRREAMEEAGIMEDPVLLKRQLAAYAKYDKDHANDNA